MTPIEVKIVEDLKSWELFLPSNVPFSGSDMADRYRDRPDREDQSGWQPDLDFNESDNEVPAVPKPLSEVVSEMEISRGSGKVAPKLIAVTLAMTLAIGIAGVVTFMTVGRNDIPADTKNASSDPVKYADLTDCEGKWDLVYESAGGDAEVGSDVDVVIVCLDSDAIAWGLENDVVLETLVLDLNTVGRSVRWYKINNNTEEYRELVRGFEIQNFPTVIISVKDKCTEVVSRKITSGTLMRAYEKASKEG